MRFRVLIPIGLLVVACTAAAVSLKNDGSGDGPLEGGTLSLGHSSEVGEPFSMTNVALFNYGKKPAVVERIRLLGVTGPLELLGVHARRIPSEDGYPIGAEGFPPRDYTSKPLPEENVVPVPASFTPAGEPEEHMQLVIGVRTTAAGVAGARRIEVTYRVGSRRYREEIQNSVWLCSPPSEYEPNGGCPPREAEKLTGDRTLG